MQRRSTPFLRALVVGALLGTASGPAAADCPASASALRADVDAAVASYGAWDWPGFARGRLVVDADLACLGEQLSPADVARLHLLHALAAGQARDDVRARAAFQGLIAAEPGFVMDDDLAAPGSLLRRAWDGAREPSFEAGRALSGPAWMVDGRQAGALPLARAALVQLQEAEVQTWYLDGGGLPPTLEGAIRAKEGLVERRVSPCAGTGTPCRRSHGYAVASAVAVGFAAGSFAVAYQTTQAYEGSNAALADLNHAAYATGAGFGVASVALLTGALVRGEW